MECFNCLKCCPCKHYTEKGNEIHVFCSESCSKAYQVDDTLLEVEKDIIRCKKNIETCNAKIKANPTCFNLIYKKGEVAELMVLNALLKRRPKEEIKRLADLARGIMVDVLEYLTENGDSNMVLIYAESMKNSHDSFEYNISVLGM